FVQIVEGDVVQGMAGRADFLIDLKAALQGAAVIGAEGPLEGELHGLDRIARGVDGGQGGRRGEDRDCQAERKNDAHHGSHSAAAGTPSTDWAMEAGSFFGVSISPTIGMISQKKA